MGWADAGDLSLHRSRARLRARGTIEPCSRVTLDASRRPPCRGSGVFVLQADGSWGTYSVFAIRHSVVGIRQPPSEGFCLIKERRQLGAIQKTTIQHDSSNATSTADILKRIRFEENEVGNLTGFDRAK